MTPTALAFLFFFLVQKPQWTRFLCGHDLDVGTESVGISRSGACLLGISRPEA